MKKYCVLFVIFLFFVFTNKAQVSSGAALLLSLNKTNPTYSGNSIQVRRACDNATVNIGYTACGNLDTIALNNFAGLHTFPFNSITTPAATVFSLRKMDCSYSGSAICIQSTAAGSPTMNVGFTVNGDLDTVSMKAFVGSNSAYILIWYDQSGNGRNAFPTHTGTSRPRIMLSGVIDRQGSRPAIRFLGGNGAGRGLATSNLNIYGTAACFNAVTRVVNNVTYNTFVNQSTSNYPSPIDHYNGTVVVGDGSGSYAFYNPSQVFNASQGSGIWTYQASGVTAANIKMWHNSVNILTGSSNAPTFNSANRPLYLGTRNDYLTSLDGTIAEVVTFSVIPSNIDRNFLEWTQAQYYGISGVTLGTLPAGTFPMAYVSVWYDQSGNGKNLYQTTFANQPRIINTGIVEKQNSIPTLNFNGTSHILSTSDAGLPTGNITVSAIVKSNVGVYGGGNYGSFLHYGASGSGNSIFGTFGTDGNMGTNAICISQYGDALGVPNSINSNIIYSAHRTSSNYRIYKNGGSLSTKSMTSNTTLYGAGGLSVGANNSSLSGSFLNGNISEVSIYPEDLSETRRILLESNRAAYANITVATNKYTPPSSTSYVNFVNGIGRESATDTVLGTQQTVGMGVASGTISATDFLQSNGDYIMFGINCPGGPGTSVSNLPATIVQRWINDWYVYKTDVGTNGGRLRIYFDYSDYGYNGTVLPGVASNYELLYRNTSSGTFVIVATTKTVLGDRVIFDLDASLLPTGYYTIGTKNTSVSPLPIELLYFNAEADKKNKLVNLSWATATEINNDYFTIEKSLNGVDFIEMKTVDSKASNGNSLSQLTYNEIDYTPFSGISYYRLKQTDFNGTYKYSKIQDVRFDEVNTDIYVFPNPNFGKFAINVSGLSEKVQPVQITITDALGQHVFDKVVQLSLNKNQVDIMLSGEIAKGVYFVLCKIDDTVFTKKIVID